MSAENAGGFLAIWSDIAPEHETEYLHWLTREHAAERLGVEGFLSARVYRALDRERRYFIRYALASPEVMASAAYRARLDAPTQWSRRVMPRLGGFVRGGGRIAAQMGSGSGAYCASIELGEGLPRDGAALLEAIVARDRIVSATLLETDVDATAIRTNEKAIRSGDRTFRALLLIEGLDAAGVADAAAAAGFEAEARLHRLIFAL
jgi:hypothetical protein